MEVWTRGVFQESGRRASLWLRGEAHDGCVAPGRSVLDFERGPADLLADHRAALVRHSQMRDVTAAHRHRQRAPAATAERRQPQTRRRVHEGHVLQAALTPPPWPRPPCGSTPSRSGGRCDPAQARSGALRYRWKSAAVSAPTRSTSTPTGPCVDNAQTIRPPLCDTLNDTGRSIDGRVAGVYRSEASASAEYPEPA